MNIKEFLKEHIVILDGGMGTLLQASGLLPGEHPERWNLTRPEVVTAIHRDYFDAGSNVVNTNTFGANRLKFSAEELEEIICAAVNNAKLAKETSRGTQEKFIALDIGPTGKLLKPYGDLDFEDAVAVFAEVVRLGVKYGVDLIMIETMSDSYETKAALLAAKENSELPVFVSNAYGESGRLMTGASPEAMLAMLEGMHADVIGVNCSLGPKQLCPIVEKMLSCSSVPVLLKPNAGLPQSRDGKTVYDVLPDDFAADVADMVRKGARVVGGCCGTTPAYIAALSEQITGLSPIPVSLKNRSVISSYTQTLVFGDDPILIGERIDPTVNESVKQALLDEDIDSVLDEGWDQQDCGAQLLRVKVGLPDMDEARMLELVRSELQAVINLPLQIDTSDLHAMEVVLRRYNGKAMINSVNGDEKRMRGVFQLVQKYGGLVVAQTSDEGGMPATADERFQIAKKILAVAAEYGVGKQDLILEPFVEAEGKALLTDEEGCRAAQMIRERLGCLIASDVLQRDF